MVSTDIYLNETTRHAEPVSLDTLSVALAANGDYERAITTLKKAIVLVKRTGKPTAKMEARLKLFHAGRPYLE